MSTQGIYDRASSDTKFSNPVIRWIDYRLPVFTFLHHELHEYPTPRNLNYLWNFGSLAGIVLVIMIMTGIVLVMYYVPTAGGAFNSVEHIMRDVNYGWLIRFVHTSGASMFFAAVYIHIFRGLYYGSYKAPRELLTYAGGQPREGIWLILSRFGAAYYFLHFLVVLPLVGKWEQPRPLPISISRPVLPTTDGNVEIRDIKAARGMT